MLTISHDVDKLLFNRCVMFLKSLQIKNLKLIESLKLDFSDPSEADGIRRWSVLIGKNGRGKTAILQAIALASAGDYHANDLGKSIIRSLRPQDNELAQTEITAKFQFESPPYNVKQEPRTRTLSAARMQRAGERVLLTSTVTLTQGFNNLDCRSSFDSEEFKSENILRDARSRGLPYWFVVAYGVNRHLRASDGPVAPPSTTEMHLERLRSIFDPSAVLRAIRFADVFEDKRTKLFSKFLQHLIQNNKDLFPELKSVELRGQSGIRNAEDLLDRNRISQRMSKDKSISLPATWLSQGYQSSLAWLADMIGHWLFEDMLANDIKTAYPDELQGVVLIDELDLHLHPSWQASFIGALKATFPHIQFIATTHSPMLLPSLKPNELIVLELDEHGKIQARQDHADPRLLTNGELYQEFFNIKGLLQNELAMTLEDYRFWARNPNRPDDINAKLPNWKRTLEREGIKDLPAIITSKNSA